jgi:hypothetical protein
MDEIDPRDVPQGGRRLFHGLLDRIVPALGRGTHQFDNLDDSHRSKLL